MFYCDPCARDRKWPITMFRSLGRCEICEQRADCSDTPYSQLPKPPETITGSAVMYEDIGVLSLPAPARHHHVMWIRLMIDGVPTRGNDVQGFITSKGRFVDRVEGLILARAADQLAKDDDGSIIKHGNPDMLFSEDVWDTPPASLAYRIQKIGEDDEG